MNQTLTYPASGNGENRVCIENTIPGLVSFRIEYWKAGAKVGKRQTAFNRETALAVAEAILNAVADLR